MPRGGARPGGGRPKGATNLVTRDLKELCQQHGPAMVKELARLASTADSEAARVAAIKEMLDRGYGKSRQPVDLPGLKGFTIKFDDD